MPHPIDPGVLGMARMMRAFRPQAAASALIDVPAAMEIIKAPDRAKPASASASPFKTCGLIATRHTEGLRSTSDGVAKSAIFFVRASLRSSAEGLGSTTRMDLTPRPSQPFNRAPPILPAPMSSMLTALSRLAGALQHRGRDGVFRRLAAPKHELEGGVVMLASLQRQVEQRLALGGAGLR